MSGAMSGALMTGEPLKAQDMAPMAPTADAASKLPRPQARDKASVRFAPKLEKVSEGQSTSSTDGSLADSPGTSPPRPARPSRYWSA